MSSTTLSGLFRGSLFFGPFWAEQKTFSVFSQRQKLQQKCVWVTLWLSKTDGTTTARMSAAHTFSPPFSEKKKNQSLYPPRILHKLCITFFISLALYSLELLSKRFSIRKTPLDGNKSIRLSFKHPSKECHKHTSVYILFDVGGEMITLLRTV